MVSRHILQSYLISLMIVMAQAGSKAGKNGKGGSGGGRWNGNLRPKPWNPRDKWSSPDSWSGRTKKSKDSKSDDYDDSKSDDKRKPMCSLANPVEEQIDIIEAPWKAAYLPNNANANVIKTEEMEIAWHANLLMNKFMEIVEDYYDGNYDREDIEKQGEFEGSSHPTTGNFNFNGDKKENVLCAQTKALVLMMKESCLYSRWKKTLEIVAYYYMKGFIKGFGVDGFNISKCVDEPKLPKEKKSNKKKNDDEEDDDDVDDDFYGRNRRN